jgi:hypothetical protein
MAGAIYKKSYGERVICPVPIVIDSRRCCKFQDKQKNESDQVCIVQLVRTQLPRTSLSLLL